MLSSVLEGNIVKRNQYDTLRMNVQVNPLYFNNEYPEAESSYDYPLGWPCRSFE